MTEKMSVKTEKPARRDVLKALGLGAGAAVATAPIAASPAVAIETQDERRKARYRESDHVKRFYETNRYPK